MRITVVLKFSPIKGNPLSEAALEPEEGPEAAQPSLATGPEGGSSNTCIRHEQGVVLA